MDRGGLTFDERAIRSHTYTTITVRRPMGFMIEHPDGRRYEVESLDALKQHDGFTIAKTQPRWGVVPEQPKPVKVTVKAVKDNGAAE